MSTIAHKPVTGDAAGPEVLVRTGIKPAVPARRAAPRRELHLNWSIARDAAVAAGLAVEGNGPVVLRIGVAWKRGVERLTAGLVDGERVREIEVSETRAEWVSEEGLVHLDLPGVLRVSVRESPWSVLYARTDLIAALGLGGGRYEFESGMLIESE